MTIAALVLTLLVGIEHIYIFVLEAFLWNTPRGMKTFGMDAAKAQATAQLAVNQGCYNLVLAVGLIWAAFAAEPIQFPIRVFFLGSVVFAGIVGGLTANKRILAVQMAPALIGLIVVVIAHGF